MQKSEIIDQLPLTAVGWERTKTVLFQYGINLLAAVAILFIGRYVARSLSNAVEKVLQLQLIDNTIVFFIKMVVHYAIVFIALIAALSAVGVQTTSILAVLGTAGLAIAFAIKDSLANFAAGILLVLFRPFRVEEVIEVAGVTGCVERLYFFSTVLRTMDYKMVVIPNGTIIKGNIINYSRNPERRIELVVGVAYNSDIEQVKQLLTQLAQKDARILSDPPVAVRLKEIAPSSLDFIVRVWVKNADYWPVYFDLLEQIKRVLDAHKINIPFPQMDVHLYPTER